LPIKVTKKKKKCMHTHGKSTKKKKIKKKKKKRERREDPAHVAHKERRMYRKNDTGTAEKKLPKEILTAIGKNRKQEQPVARYPNRAGGLRARKSSPIQEHKSLRIAKETTNKETRKRKKPVLGIVRDFRYPLTGRGGCLVLGGRPHLERKRNDIGYQGPFITEGGPGMLHSSERNKPKKRGPTLFGGEKTKSCRKKYYKTSGKH